MRLAMISNWGADICGVAQFGWEWMKSLQDAGHSVMPIYWDDPIDPPLVDHVLINWDSGTLPLDKPIRQGATVFVHHIYRGVPEGLANAELVLSPVNGFATYFPYPVPVYRGHGPVRQKILGVTTLRHEGVDYLKMGAALAGWTVKASDVWRPQRLEIERLSTCHAVGLWYTDSPGRSLALATAIAAQRPLLLSAGTRMFEYAETSPEPYWAIKSLNPMRDDPQSICAALKVIEADGSRIPVNLATAWSWPVAIQQLEALWRRSQS